MPKASRKSESEPVKEIKKAKKDASIPTLVVKPKEVCKNVMDFEEKELDMRSGEEDFKQFKDTCSKLCSLMKDILNMKLKANADKTQNVNITAKKVEASLLFVTLKKLNRLDKLRLKRARDLTHDAKQRVDTFHLQLENLLYEVFHLQKEVDKCLEFKSKDEDIELVSEEEFYRDAPSNISKTEVTKNDQHKKTLARLEWEFEQRKRLSEQCRTIDKKRESVTNEITKKQKHLENLFPRLNAILEATRPLQEELNLPLERIKFQKELAALLPDPLYILYSQMKAYIEACDSSMEVSIEGRVEDARNFGSKLKSGLDEILEDVDSESDVEDDYEVNKRVAIASQEVKSDPQLIKHPLRIQLKIDHVVVLFSYLSTLNIVTVDCKSTMKEDNASGSLMDNLFTALFENDFGDESPNRANCFQSKSVGNFKSLELGKPYLWAQRLSGLDFSGAVKSAPTCFTKTDYVEKVVAELKNRVLNRFQLNKILLSLGKGDLHVNADSNAAFPLISSCLISWVSTDHETISKIKHFEQLAHFMDVNPKNMLFFKTVFQRESAKLNAIVMVPVDYPSSTPIFSLQLDWQGKHTRENSEDIRKIEAEVNLYGADVPEQHKIELLPLQLKKLSLCLDLITEIDGKSLNVGSGSWQSRSKPEFGTDKIIPQLLKGHDRTMPLKYEAKTGFVLHH